MRRSYPLVVLCGAAVLACNTREKPALQSTTAKAADTAATKSARHPAPKELATQPSSQIGYLSDLELQRLIASRLPPSPYEGDLPKAMEGLSTDYGWVPLGGTGNHWAVFRVTPQQDVKFDIDGRGRIFGFWIIRDSGVWLRQDDLVIRNYPDTGGPYYRFLTRNP